MLLDVARLRNDAGRPIARRQDARRDAGRRHDPRHHGPRRLDPRRLDPRRQVALWGAAALLLLTAAACGSDGPAAPEPTAAPPVSAGAEPSPATPPTAATSVPSIGPTSIGSTGGTGSPGGGPRPTAALTGVKLVKQGGIAGIDQSIEVAPDGSWRRAVDGNTTSTGRLTGDERAQLAKLLADPRLAGEGKRATGLGRCSDAFVYVLTAGKMLVHYTACGQADKPEVTLKIIQLLQNATK
ncbi:hypothetical protein ACFQS1_17910 [Paractinoplanes rhizophilus]|uniref:Uncharacterized protein n=1 Tax=Paractinoplanes rhizophilus TaxID=1416877 RepID=A0ABW2HWA3_9ACTN